LIQRAEPHPGRCATLRAGYEHCEQITVTRQIVIGGRNKYLINGHVAQPTRVQNLFHSVGGCTTIAFQTHNL
jgi:chromosome segregation ATPase